MTNTGNLTAANISQRQPMLPTPDEMVAAQAVWDARALVVEIASLTDTGRADELEKTLAQMLQTFTGFGLVAWEVLDLLKDDGVANVAEAVTMVVEDW